MWQRLKQLIKKLFGRAVTDSDYVGERSDHYVEQYKDEGKFNITAIAANKLATLTVTESNVDVGRGKDETNVRVRFMNEFIQKVWAKGRKFTAQAFGCGGVALVPYCIDGTLYFDIVQQNRMLISSMTGDVITGVSFLSDIRTIDGDIFSRFTYYEITELGCVIRNKAVKNGSVEVKLSDISDWSMISPEVLIPNCKKVPVAYLKCPVDNRRSDDFKGVPITFGCEYIMAEIDECMKQIKREYTKKKAMIFADKTMINDDNEVDEDLYVTFMGGAKLGDGSLIDVFDPQIRDTAYYKRLESLFEIMEKSMGTSKGILSEPATNYATATEIKRSIYDTFAMVENMRKSIERMMQDMLDAGNVLCDYFGLAPTFAGDMPLKFDWSYGLVESSEITFQQLSEEHARGTISDAEYRQFVKPKETLEEAQAAIDNIKNSEQTEKVGDVMVYDVQRTTTETS